MNRRVSSEFRNISNSGSCYCHIKIGFVDLTFQNCSDCIPELERILSNQLEDYSAEGFSVQRTSKFAALRLVVPVLDFHKSFESQLEKIKECFVAIQKMTDIVKKLNRERIVDILANG